MQNELFEKIELYLHNELEGEELRLFEEQLKTDKELREQLALYTTIDEEMRQKMSGNEEEEKLKETLSGLNRKYFNQGGGSAKVLLLNKRRRWLFAAAAAILLLLAGAYWLFFTGNRESGTLYAQYARHQPLSLQRDNNDGAKILQDAVKAYNNKNFNEALIGLTNYLQTDSSDAELLLAKNICLTETGNYEQAIAGLNKLAAENEIFKSQALWYKALVYLKQNNKAECKEILESIPPGADTYTKAIELLKEL
jgi:hypothetical protein